MYIDMNENPCITCLARCIKSRYNSGITNRKGENSGVIECLMPCLTPNRLYKRQQGPRFRPDGCPMFTLTACDIHGILENFRIRKLMPKECLRLQGFNDDQIDKMVSINSDNQLYKQAGNAVTVTVVQAIGERIKEIHEELNEGVK